MITVCATIYFSLLLAAEDLGFDDGEFFGVFALVRLKADTTGIRPRARR